MKLRDYYDWIVLGDHPGALLSAGLAAKLGLSVLVLPIFPALPLRREESGRVLDPESNFLLGLGRIPEANGLLAECLSQIGVGSEELSALLVEQRLPQVLTPQNRLDFGQAEDVLAMEWGREFGTDAAKGFGILPAMKRACPEILSSWLKYPERLTLAQAGKRIRALSLHSKDWQKRIGKESGGAPEAAWFSPGRTVSQLKASPGAHADLRPLREVLKGLWAGLSSEANEDPRLPSLLQLYALGRAGASVRGGMTAYREHLKTWVERLGAHVPSKAECRRVFVSRGRFAGVQLANRGSMIGGGGAVVGCSLSQLQPLISQDGRAWFRRLKKAPVPEGWRFTLSLSVKAESISPGATPRMVWQETGAPSLEMEVAEPAEYGLEGAGRKVLMARATLPFTAESLSPAYQRKVSARILRQLSEILPFIEPGVVDEFPEFRRAGEDVYGFSSLEEVPWNLRSYSFEDGQGIGSHSGIGGLFVASNESYPELGSFGGTVAALEAAAWLARRANLAGPFAR